MSSVTVTGITNNPEELAQLEHTAGENWREPFVPKPKEEEKPEAATEAEEIQATKPEAEPETEETKPEKKSGWQKRIDKLTARNAAAEARAEKAEREAAELRAKVEGKEKPAQAEDAPPKLDDFLKAGKTADDWADARDAWKDRQAAKELETERQKATFTAYNKAVSEARGKHEDFDEVLTANADVVIPQGVHVAIVGLKDKGPEVAYYLAKHPEAVGKLNELNDEEGPPAAILELGKIVDLVHAKPATESPKPKTKVTPPPPIAATTASSSRSSIPLDELPMKEYIKVRNQQERDRR